MQLKSGSQLQSGKYRIIRVLGQGGFGITYLAEHTMLDKKVAIKEFFPKEYCDREENTGHLTTGTKNTVEIVGMLRGKFVKEAKNISKLRHHNIITIYDIFQENDTAYYVMEFVEGISLSQMIMEQGNLPENKAISYIRKVADAVGYMHSLSMNHLDLKPANIMVRASDDEPILIDFGLSKQYDASGGQTSTTPIGISHGFAPIEQYRPGGVATFTPQTDIYALGTTLFNLLSGKVPPHYSEILEEGLPEFPTAISPSARKAVEHAMEIRKNNRPATIAEFLNDLTQAGKKHVSKPTYQTTVKPVQKKKSTAATTKKAEIPPLSATIHAEETRMIGESTSQNKDTGDLQPTIINGIEFVDLGLSVKWANMNVGASRPSEAGKIFYNHDGLKDIKAAFKKSIPSEEHFLELKKNCTWKIVYRNREIIGYQVVGPNGNTITLPINSLITYLLVSNTSTWKCFMIQPSEFVYNISTYIPEEYNIRLVSI
ncbi:MAG: serine/threonine protein kinase [Bacteroides sp.]|nr:serine/threonine protein kinase [Bacteroides sp.]